MSTRSGKRIHNSFHENVEEVDSEMVLRSERKIRFKRAKSSNEELNLTVPKLKKRTNYVTYPSDDELADQEKPKRKRNTLKEQNVNTDIPECDPTTSVRQTRRSKKCIDNPDDATGNDKNIELVTRKRKGKQTKKKSKMEKENDTTEAISKEKPKKKKQSLGVVESSKKVNTVERELNASADSNNSFHSAAGSLDNEKNDAGYLEDHEMSNEINTFNYIDDSNKGKPKMNSTCDNTTRKSHSIKDESVQIDNIMSISPFNVFDNKFDKDISVCDVKNSTFDMEMERNSKGTTLTEVMREVNSTSITKQHNSTSGINLENKCKSNETTFSGNGTFENIKNLSLTKPLDCTLEKDTKLDSTYDKKDSLVMTSDSEDTVNVTFDKSNSFHISITSDESKTANILNATPVLIDSSVNESQISNCSLKPSKNSDVDSVMCNDLSNNSKMSETLEIMTESKPPLTRLKREDTFTKDGPDVIIMSPTPRDRKQMSLSSPGCTPFQTKSRSVVKDRNALNITWSLEKIRHSSSSASAPRTTKVMFCSPVNNPVAVNERKSKIIKSNLKGSNKSFLFDENETLSVTRPTGRKRSLTYSEVEGARTKRKRYTEDLQKSAERLSRPRTSSAKPATTPANAPTPKSCSETKVRRKLPNFAALHQKQFAKMESLNECQERKAKRAQKLLTSKGSSGVLEKGTPKALSTDSPQPKEAQKPDTAQEKKPVTKFGYTRFGFKLNLDVNPFSIPSTSKTTSNPPVPSVSGTTTFRREIVKKTVMKEKVPTNVRRDVGRKENRTIIKGVRTNRRFELQMMSRNLNV